MAVQSGFLKKIQKGASAAQLRSFTQSSREWYFDKLKDLKNLDRRKITRDSLLVERQKPRTGRMYMFFYDPKGREVLPFYDRFPLIFMIGPAIGGFYGLNLHYLPPKLRAVFFEKLLETLNNDKMDDSTRLKLSYSLLASTAKMKYFAPCFKHYLFTHVKSKLMEVQASEWEAALFLPTENFIGANRSSVWKQSKSSI